MSYSPTLGRFLQQDPLGKPNTTRPSPSGVRGANGEPYKPDEALNAEARAVARTAGMFGDSHANDAWLWQYTGGANLYEFVGGNPLNATDPSGLDRYVIVDGGGLHTGIAVDRWELKDGRWVKVGQSTFDFSAYYCDLKTALFTLPANLLSGLGMVREEDGIRNPEYVTIPSTPQEDEKLLAEMRAQKVCPPRYGLFIFNCNDWTQKYQNYGKK